MSRALTVIAAVASILGVLASAQSTRPARLLYGAGGDFQSLGFGRYGWVLGGSSVLPNRQCLNMTAGYGLAFDGASGVGFFSDNPESPSRLPAAPGQPKYAYFTYGSQTWRLFVRVPQCVQVTLYAVDYDASREVRQRMVQKSRDGTQRGEAYLGDREFYNGVYATFVQTEWQMEYEFHRLGAHWSVLAGVFFDPADPSECGGTVPVFTQPPHLSQTTDAATGATLTYGVGGDYQRAGYGGDGFLVPVTFGSMPSLENAAPGVAVSMSGTTRGVEYTWGPLGRPMVLSDYRLLKPEGRLRQPVSFAAQQQIDVAVSVPRCARVTLYFVDYDPTTRDLAVRVWHSQTRRHHLVPLRDVRQGVYASFTQASASATYSVVKYSTSVNVVLAGVMVDLHGTAAARLACPDGFNANGDAPPIAPPHVVAPATAPVEPVPEEDEGISFPLIVIAVIGGAVVVSGVTAAVTIMCVRYHRRQEERTMQQQAHAAPGYPSQLAMPVPASSSAQAAPGSTWGQIVEGKAVSGDEGKSPHVVEGTALGYPDVSPRQ